MKILYAFPFWSLLFAPVYSQITLEYTYNVGRSNLTRVVIPNTGEKYYYVDHNARLVRFFNSNHTSWKNVPITGAPDSLDYAYVNNVFDPYLINNDNLLKLQIGYSGIDISGNYISQNQIINENGQVLFDKYGYLVNSPNGQKKLISGNEVYGLPGLNLEHTYPLEYLDNFTGAAGGKDQLFFLNYSSMPGQANIYDANHQLIKIFNFPTLNLNYEPFYHIFTTNIGDGTTDFKCLFVSINYTDELVKFQLARDNNDILFEQEFSTSEGYAYPFFYEPEPGGFSQKKIIVYKFKPSVYSYIFYNLPGYYIEKEIENGVLYNIEPGNLKWAPGRYSNSETEIQLLYPNGWGVWKTLEKQAGKFWRLNDISKFVFDNDSDFEFLHYESFDDQNYSTPIIRNEDDQSILFQESALPYGSTSRIPGYANKLICWIDNFTAGSGSYKVYSLPSSTPVPVVNAPENTIDVNISPNPTFGAVTIGFEQTPSESITVEVFNAQGIRTGFRELAPAEKIELPSASFPAQGMYVITIRSGDWKGVAKVLRQ